MENTFASMFAGCGGGDLGLTQAGWKCVWANEIDKHACQIYRKNFGDKHLVEGDIRDIHTESIPDFTLLIGGFPCQSFSIAGKRKGTTESRGTLFTQIARVAAAKRPPLLLLENVKGLLSSDDGRDFAKILRVLGNLGYLLEWQVLNSKCWVPQNRERIFIVGHLGEGSTRQIFPIRETDTWFAEGCRNPQDEGKRICPSITSRYAKQGKTDHYILCELRQSGFRQHRQDGIVPTLTQKMGTGGNNVPVIMPCLTPDRVKKRQNGRRFKEDGEPMFTLTGQDIHGVAINKEIRRLTPCECESLQGFPNKWTEGVSDTQRYRMIGNAMTVSVIKFLGLRLLACNNPEVSK